MKSSEFIYFIEEKCEIKNITNYDEESVNDILKKLDEYGIDNFNDAVFLGHGTYSDVFKIKDYVIKIGSPKIKYEIIYDEFFIETFFRIDFNIFQNNFRRVVGIELQRYAESIFEISEMQMFAIYSCLRKKGIMWRDVKKENLGIYNNKIVIIDTDEFYYDDFKFSTMLAKKFEMMYEKTNDNN